MRKTVCIFAVMPVLLLAGCAQDDQAGSSTASTWKAELLKYRKEKDERFQSSGSSPMAGTQYLKSEPTDRVWLTRDQKTFALSYSEPGQAVLSLDRTSGTWRWKAEEEGVVANEASLEDPATFHVDGLELSFYPSDERATFIVFDPERPEKQEFEHLLYFAPDREYAVDARLERFPQADEVEMLTNRNLVKTFYRYAKIRFELEGQEQELTAFKSTLTGEGSKRLFIPFRDATSGHETYGAGRFLRVDAPDGDDFVLDFNRSFNPYCAYSPAYNCSIPPAENHLEVPVRAGEKTYRASFRCEIDRDGFRPEIESEWREYTLNTLNRPRRPTLVEGLEKLAELRDSSEALTVVDLGAGAGNDTRYLLADGHRVHAVEPDPFAVAVIEECARRQGTSERLEVQAASFETMTLPEKRFDLAHASLSLPFAAPETFDRVWDEIAESLAVGGVFSGDFFGPEHEWADNQEMTFLTEEQVRALFERHPLEILELREERGETELASGGTALFHSISVIAIRR